jgi:hypothetical protein
MDKSFPRGATLALLLAFGAFGTSGCARDLCALTSPNGTGGTCPARPPMQPTYFPS